ARRGARRARAAVALPQAAAAARALRRDGAGARSGGLPRDQRHDPAQGGGARARRRGD
ncbi:MAG: Shikimate 5-dehydrogenase I alpha, partial [uncultured Gemmatimonadaceae bacterium]